jgi:hypothetical protein
MIFYPSAFHTSHDLRSLKILSNLVIFLPIVCPAIAILFEMLSLSFMILGLFMTHCMIPLLIILGACLDLQVLLPHFFDVFGDKNCVGYVQHSYLIKKCFGPI